MMRASTQVDVGRPFWILWFGQTISALGDRTYLVALPLILLLNGFSSADLGSILAILSFGQILGFLVAGVTVDRYPKLLLILGTDVLQAFALVLLSVIVALDGVTLPLLWGVSAIFGLATSVSMPAARSVIPELVRREGLVRANALFASTQDVATLIAPSVAAFLVSVSAVAVFGANSVTFLLSACSIVLILRRFSPKHAAEDNGVREKYLGQMKEGLRETWRLPWLRVSLPYFAFVNMAVAGSLGVALPFLFVSPGDASGAGAYALILTSLAIGSVLAAVLLGRVGERIRRRGPIAYSGVVAVGLSVLVLPFASTAVVYLVAATLGAGVIVFGALWDTLLQTLVPSELLGRVVSVDLFASFALLPIGYLLIGEAASAWSPTAVMVVAGTLVAASALALMSTAAVRNVDGPES